jgi:hypothetical protein
MTDPVQFPPLPISNVRVAPPAQPTLDSIIAQSLIADDTPTAPSIPTSIVGSPNKESLPPRSSTEVTHIVELNETEPLPPEVEGWLQKLDTAGDIKLPEPITHDGNVLLANSEAQIVKEKIVLPMTQSGVQQGLTAKVTDSARWLAEWCVRLIKSMKSDIKYAPETTNGKV